MDNYKIIPVSTELISEIARLHAIVMPHSPISELGWEFMTQVYFPTLLQEGHGEAVIAYYKGKPVGMTAYAFDSHSFYTALGRKRIKIIKAVAKEIKRDLSTLSTVIRATRFYFQKNTEPTSEIPAEHLAIIVLEEYRASDFVRKNRLYFARDLFHSAMESMRSKGINKFRLFTDDYETNPQANIFYRMLGGTLVWSGMNRGHISNAYVFDLM